MKKDDIKRQIIWDIIDANMPKPIYFKGPINKGRQNENWFNFKVDDPNPPVFSHPMHGQICTNLLMSVKLKPNNYVSIECRTSLYLRKSLRIMKVLVRKGRNKKQNATRFPILKKENSVVGSPTVEDYVITKLKESGLNEFKEEE